MSDQIHAQFQNQQIASMLRSVADKLEAGVLVKESGGLSFTIDPVGESPRRFGITANLIFLHKEESQ